MLVRRLNRDCPRLDCRPLDCGKLNAMLINKRELCGTAHGGAVLADILGFGEFGNVILEGPQEQLGGLFRALRGDLIEPDLELPNVLLSPTSRRGLMSRRRRTPLRTHRREAVRIHRAFQLARGSELQH
jgi:hypothetical protein